MFIWARESKRDYVSKFVSFYVWLCVYICMIVRAAMCVYLCEDIYDCLYKFAWVHIPIYLQSCDSVCTFLLAFLHMGMEKVCMPAGDYACACKFE